MDECCSLDSLEISEVTVKTPMFESTALSTVQAPPQQLLAGRTEPQCQRPSDAEDVISEHAIQLKDEKLDDFFEQELSSAKVSLSSLTPIAGEKEVNLSHRGAIELSKPIQGLLSGKSSVPRNTDGPSGEKHSQELQQTKNSTSQLNTESHNHSRHASVSNPCDGSKTPTPVSPAFNLSPAVTKTRLDPQTQAFENIAPILTDDGRSPRAHINLEDRNDNVLSAWEKWMLKKTEEALEKQKALKMEKLARQRLRAECEEAEAKRRAKAAMVHKQWVKQKRVEEATRREEESARLAAEKKAEEERQQASLAKAAACYEEWSRKSEEERQKLKAKRKEQAKKEALRAQELQQKADHAYKVWFKTVGCKKLDSNLLNGISSSKPW